MASPSSTSSSASITGSCLCRDITYELAPEAEPVFSMICHCDNCKKCSGSQMACASMYMKHQFNITSGTPSTYEDSVTDSTKPLFRHFCGKCGSNVYAEPEVAGKLIVLFTGSLDAEFREKWSPNKEQFIDTKHHYYPGFDLTEKMGIPMRHPRSFLTATGHR